MEYPNPNTNPTEFFKWLKEESEKYWETININNNIYGFQIQSKTKWNPGLSDLEIHKFEEELGFEFPEILKSFLHVMNGTSPESINIYGNRGEPAAFSPGYYVYPKDITMIKEMIEWIMDDNDLSKDQMKKEGIPAIFPIISHRFLVIDESNNFPVLSMYGNDIILYAADLPSFLINDIFFKSRPDPNLDDSIKVKFWLE